MSAESSAFVCIAKDQHLFGQNGLDVTIKTFDTAPAAIDALMKNQVDLRHPESSRLSFGCWPKEISG